MPLPMLFALFAATMPGVTAPPAPAARVDTLVPLSYFVGDWQCAGQFANGRAIRSRESFDLALDGHWLRMRHEDEAPNRYRAVEWWKRDPSGPGYAVVVFDNGGGLRHYASAGWNGDTLVLENTASSGYIDRFSFRRLDNASYQLDYSHRGRNGAWQPGDSLRCTKPAPPTR
jgi:hypothetical protein